jgi:hypothetical protein
MHRESILGQWSKPRVVDLPSDAVMFDRLITFGGRDNEAWKRAEAFTIRAVRVR